MKDKDKTREQLLDELADLRQRVAELESSSAEREQAEKALGRSEEAYRLLFEQSVDGITIIAKGRIVRANRAFCDLHGLPVEDVVGMNPLDLVHPEDRDVGDQRIKEVQSGKAVPETHVYRASRADGASLWVEVRSKHIEWGGEKALQSIVRDVTARVRAEEERAQAEETLRFLSSAVEQSAEGIAMSDLEGNLLYVNSVFATLHGYTQEEIIGKPLSIFHLPEQMSSVEAANRQVQETGEFSGEIWHVRRDGTAFPTLMHNSLLRDEAGNPFGMIAMLRDVTERKQAEEALRESEARYRDLFENSVLGIYRTTPDGRILEANPALVRILGYSSFAELSQRNLQVEGFEPRHERSRFEEHIEKEGQVVGLESAWTRSDGTSVFVRENARAVHDEEGNILYYEGTVEDITEIKKADEALRESEERFRSIVENSQAGILIIGEDFCFIYVNDEFCRILDRRQEEIIGHDFREFLDEEDHALVVDRYRRRQAGEDVPPRYEINIVRKSGELRRAEISSTVIKDAERVRTVAQILDITERVRAEEERAQADEALRASEMRFRSIAETANDAIIIFDNQDSIFYWNRAAQIIFGYQMGETHGRLLASIVPRRFHDIFRQEMAQAASAEASDSRGKIVEMMGIRKDGNEFPLELSLAAWRIKGDIFFTAIVRDITERKRAEEKLRESERRYRALFEHSNDGVFIIDSNGTYIAVNQQGAGMLGYKIDELVGESAELVVAPEELGDARQRLDTFLSGSALPLYERTFLAKDGTRVQAEISLTVVRDAQDQPLHFQSVVRDITERKRAEEALKRRMDHLAALSQASRAVTASLELDQVLAKIVSLAGEVVATDYTSVVLVDETGRMNDSADNVPGIPAIEYRVRDEGLTDWIVRSRWVAVIDEIGEDGALNPGLGEGAPRFANPLLVEAGVKSLAGLPLVVKDQLLGVLYLHSLQTNAFRDQLPLLIAFANQVAIAIENARLYEETQRELAERERVEKALRASQEYARSIIDSSLDMIVTVTMDRRIVEFNQAAQKTFGYDRASVVEKPIDMLYADEQEAIAVHETTVAKGQCVQEIFNRRENGEIFPALLSASVLRDAQGKVIGVMGVSRDITENKRIEKQLRQQERMAAVGQLSGGIAHDFNNFLTAIMLYAQLLLAKPHLPLDLAPDIEIILDESREAARLVQQILDFSRRAMIETGPVDLKLSIGKTVGILRRTLPENIHLVVETEMEECIAPFTVNADQARIQQVLMNLALNARDAMPLGGKLGIGLSRVEVKVGDEPPVVNMPAGNWVCLTVSDTGTGILPDVLPHVFEPFFTTKGAGKGTGLGLAQVHGIVGQHGGHIGVETEIGQGTTFRIYLPAHEVKSTGGNPEEVSTPPEGRGETILLAEDEERVRKAGQEILESLGYRVLMAADGREALEVYRSAEEIHLVITDLMMPEMGGRELAQALKKEHPHVRVLAITGYELGEDESLKEAGILAVVHKPFDVDTLAKTVHRILEAEKPEVLQNL